MSGYVREMRRTKTDGWGRQEGGRERERGEREKTEGAEVFQDS